MPINLVNNQHWEILMTAGNERFHVRRNGEVMSVIAFDIDPVTGKATLSADVYDASFYTDANGNQTLQVTNSWFEFPTIYAGFHEHYYGIPVSLTTTTIEGKEVRDNEYRSTAIDQPVFIAVQVMSKDQAEFPCDVRGEHHQGDLVYYTLDSQFFNQVHAFQCFQSESAARAAGYVKSLQ